ncbi:MBL fold metallo-hydrolase [Pseudonocardia nigra]|uniref:MBL fold metallo-hydrolase n=1 Tax=Pseudonocardia nigra TaxID=1921578 RepID=UPI003558FAE9
MRVHHPNCGIMRPPGGRLVDGRPGSAGVRGRSVTACCWRPRPGSCSLRRGWAHRRDGIPPHGSGSRFVALTDPLLAEDESALSHVRRLGLDARDIQHVVLTHLDLDHTGGLVDFPEATVRRLGHRAARPAGAPRPGRTRALMRSALRPRPALAALRARRRSASPRFASWPACPLISSSCPSPDTPEVTPEWRPTPGTAGR